MNTRLILVGVFCVAVSQATQGQSCQSIDTDTSDWFSSTGVTSKTIKSNADIDPSDWFSSTGVTSKTIKSEADHDSSALEFLYGIGFDATRELKAIANAKSMGETSLTLEGIPGADVLFELRGHGVTATIECVTTLSWSAPTNDE